MDSVISAYNMEHKDSIYLYYLLEGAPNLDKNLISFGSNKVPNYFIHIYVTYGSNFNETLQI